MSLNRTSAMLLCSISLTLSHGFGAEGAKRGPWDTAKLFTAPAYRESPKAKKDGLKALLYAGLPYRGKPTEVFAYYAAPKGKPPNSGWPAR